MHGIACGYLLVEPDYYARYPPLGLLKIATYHRLLGDEVYFVRGLTQAQIPVQRRSTSRASSPTRGAPFATP